MFSYRRAFVLIFFAVAGITAALMLRPGVRVYKEWRASSFYNESVIHWEAGEETTARELAFLANKYAPGNPSFLRHLALVCEREQRLSAYTQLARSQVFSDEDCYELIRTAFDMGLPTVASRYLAMMRKRFTTSTYLPMLELRMLMYMNRYSEALSLSEEIVEKGSDDLQVYEIYFSLCFGSGSEALEAKAVAMLESMSQEKTAKQLMALKTLMRHRPDPGLLRSVLAHPDASMDDLIEVSDMALNKMDLPFTHFREALEARIKISESGQLRAYVSWLARHAFDSDVLRLLKLKSLSEDSLLASLYLESALALADKEELIEFLNKGGIGRLSAEVVDTILPAYIKQKCIGFAYTLLGEAEEAQGRWEALFTGIPDKAVPTIESFFQRRDYTELLPDMYTVLSSRSSTGSQGKYKLMRWAYEKRDWSRFKRAVSMIDEANDFRFNAGIYHFVVYHRLLTGKNIDPLRERLEEDISNYPSRIHYRILLGMAYLFLDMETYALELISPLHQESARLKQDVSTMLPIALILAANDKVEEAARYLQGMDRGDMTPDELAALEGYGL